MFEYFKMKKQEWKLKSIIYSAILGTIDEKKDIIELLKKTYETLKNSNGSEFQDKLVAAFAKIIHESSQSNKD